MNWKTIHGEGDDPLMPGTYVVEAHGITFDPPVKMTEVARAIQKIGAAARIYMRECIETNKKIRKALPKGAQMNAFGRKILEQILDAHREETGETITIVRINDKKLSKISRNVPSKECETHKKLVVKYCDEEPMRSDDLNRAIMVGLCEDRVLLEESRVKTRSKISLTPKALWDHIRTEERHIDDSCRDLLVSTLVDDGWVLFMKDEEVRLLPYGKGVPAFDEKANATDHPAWSRDPSVEWDV
jgi:hypothetical protein